MDYSSFEKIIMKHCSVFIIVSIILVIVSIFTLCYTILKMKDDKPMFFTLLSLSLIAILGSFILGSNVVYSSIYDIRNRAYITYEGEFSISKKMDSKGNCTLLLYDAKKTELEIGAYVLDAGNHTGKVIYGEKTKIVLSVKQNPE